MVERFSETFGSIPCGRGSGGGWGRKVGSEWEDE